MSPLKITRMSTFVLVAILSYPPPTISFAQ